MGAAQSTRIESTVQDIACPCASNDASGQENVETYKAIQIEQDESSSDDVEDSSVDEEEWFEERLQILEESSQLRRLAEFFLCPEKAITVDPTAMARCYFSRYSAADQADFEEDDEREQILADMNAMKKHAVDYLHPELPVVTTDPFACGRNYFDRPSAVQPDSSEDADERAHILADMKAMKKLAVDYLHPELPVVTTDPFACGRNYFDRPSAVQPDSSEDADERAQVLADMKAMKKLAVDYLHPELPVVTTDPFACGRNYFDHPSAVQPDSSEDADECERILAEMKAMKKLAVDYLHPELPVVTKDPFACGRNYFDRPSAVQTDSSEDADELEQILADMKAMKKLAVDYLHPELPVVTTDPFACGRNYFTRASAESYDSIETESALDEDERHEILEDLRWMKTLADGFMHPEVSVDYSGFASDHGGHFDMDEDVPLTWTLYHPTSGTCDNIKPVTSAHGEEANMAFSPPCVMLMH